MKKLYLKYKCWERMLFRLCPECNSDAPYMYECPVCEYHCYMKPYADVWKHRYYELHNLKK